MSEDKIEPTEEVESRVDKLKDVVKRNWKPYCMGAGTVIGIVVIAGVTCYFTRGRKIVILSKMPLLGEIIPSEGRNLTIKQLGIFNKGTFHITNNHGAPVQRFSRMIECVETGRMTPTVVEMAAEMDVSASHITKHLGYPSMYPSVKGYHFKHRGYVVPTI